MGSSILCSKCKEIPVKRPASAQSKQNSTNETGIIETYVKLIECDIENICF